MRTESNRYAIVGLGNPGKKYAATRHNLGFWVVERLSPASSFKKEEGCLVAQATVADSPCVLIMPQKYMNLSGEAAAPLIRYFRIPPEQTIVVYDELDLEPGVVRIRKGGSAGGHRGLADMMEQMGDAEFIRVRVGIGHPRNRKSRQEQSTLGGPSESAAATPDVSDWVLSAPGPEEKELLEASVSNAAEAIKMIIASGLDAAQNKCNRRERSV